MALFVHRIEENDRGARVKVPQIVTHFLIPPDKLAGLGMDGDDGGGIGIVTLAEFAIEIGTCVAGGEKNRAILGIDRGRIPDRAAAIFPRIPAPTVTAGLVRGGCGIETPYKFASLSTECL